MEDQRIIELYWSRSTEAIQQTAHKYGAYCFSVADRILHSKEDAEECVNDTWLRAWNSIPPHRPQRFSLFLAKITRNLAFNQFHAKSAEKRGGGEMDLVLDELAECLACETDVAAAYEAKELGQSIRRFVSSLPERDSGIFLRRYFFAEPISEIAKRLRITENNVMVILSRTRKKLKSQLIKEGYFHE